MNQTFQELHYPLGIQCGNNYWNRLKLTEQLSQPVQPTRTYLLHLVADRLRTEYSQGLSATELELWAVLNQALRQIGRHFLQSRNCQLTIKHLTAENCQIELPEFEPLLRNYLQLFPARSVCLQQNSVEQLLTKLEETEQLNELLLELFLLLVQSQNPAITTASPLFKQEEAELQRTTNYHQQLQLIDQALPEIDDGFRHASPSLLNRLLEPLRQTDSLSEQLLLLQESWGGILSPELLERMTSAFVLYEHEGVIPGPPGEPETTTLDPAAFLDEEYANFTVDLDWMPRTVLLAKSIYVWLHQLSNKYRCHIYRLDQIPDEELNEISSSGFTSLWLIGIWQRSRASQKIKNLTGKLQVAASAYAIHDYRIADDLGGDSALENLRERCQQRNIDLACDVVTNHTGIDSTWVRQHPEWFIQLQHPPYPGYRFTSPDLSDDAEFAVQIEDGYFNHTEAAVVCRYQNRHNGEIRYLYHGNDGTHLPWNDTAQLNYLLPEVRETMIQLILQVAKRFRVIRFDAAMTLAKRHFQRLWFPLPGGGAGVPSREDHALSHEKFNQLFPIEFWKELVDRIRSEAPDTLLVAEAFWLMEGYFVRTLGMHRVYNSAFMNMLKREENGKYRQTLKNILSFDPAILQRFVNFMSNPDEKPAVEQFGRDEKYLCIATMLATMPGLPMFAHGQTEGFHEKYGMEYLQPQWQEQVDQQLVDRHHRHIFPLLRKRALFSGSEHFHLYDFVSDFGIEEDVFVYSNRLENRTVLIICNNSSHQINGRIGTAVHRSDKTEQSFNQACDIGINAGETVLFTDLSTGLQHLHPATMLANGGQFQLPPYNHRVYSDFHSQTDTDGRWLQLWQRFGNTGRQDLYADYDGLLIEPLLQLMQQLIELPTTTRNDPEFASILRFILAEIDQPHLKDFSSDRFFQLLFRVLFPQESELVKPLLAELQQQLLNDPTLPQSQLFNILDRLYNQRTWRKLLKCNYYNEVDWFNQETFEKLNITFNIYIIHHCHKYNSIHFRELQIITKSLLMNMKAARVFAEESSYQVDIFLQSLDGGPSEGQVLSSVTGGENAMKILFVTPEATPFAKTGGLADVAGSLPRALRQLGHDIRVIMPCHSTAGKSGINLRKGRKSVEVTLQGQTYRGSLKQAAPDGVPHWFIDCPEFFDREPLYGTADGDYPDNSLRFGFFCRAVLEMIKRLDFRPDIIHIHDWQTSFIPVMLRTELKNNPFYSSIATLLTIHNLGYQGCFPKETLSQLELAEHLNAPDAMEFFGNISALKGGINSADIINTVSPNYCQEIQGEEQGHGFDGILRQRNEDLHGIVNGLDLRSWDPALDTALPTAFNVENLNGKRACKRYLQKELGLEVRHDVPIVAMISRLDQQKGIDLIEQAWPELLKRNLQFVLLGSGDHQAMAFWKEQQDKNPERVSINLDFNESLSRRIYAASDLFMVPSRYEPCGLTQMIALHYGALPIVRNTGGLADTVIDITADPRRGYGFIFENSDPAELLASLDRGLELYPQRSRWLTLIKRGMKHDFSWTNSAKQYIDLYLKARDLRQMPAA